MLALAEILAVALFAVPLGVVLAARSRADRALWEYALEIPMVVALDLLVVLLLARFVRLELAVLVTRPAWAALGAVAIVRGRKAGRVAWPAALRRRELAGVGAAMAAAIGVSVVLSRSCLYADRAWHIPLVSSFRGQVLPFANVYEPRGQLPYHYAGDVFAALFQILSFDSIHASRALSLAHDVAFGLTGASAALLLLWLGVRRVIAITGIVLSMLLAGPLAALGEGKNSLDSGYNFGSNLRLSYRPHHCLADLLMVGFAGAALVRLRSSRADGQNAMASPGALATALPLVSVTAILALTDEASTGVLGLSLGVAWLFFREIVHPRRGGGVLVLAALLGAAVVPLLLFGGSLAPGAPRHAVTMVPWRSPGFNHPSVPLSTGRGLKLLFFDLVPMLAATAIGIGVVIRRRRRDEAAALVFYGALLVVSTLLLTRIDVDKLSVESHRFMSASVFLFPLLLASWIAPVDASADASRALAWLAPAAGIVVMGASSLSTLDWLVYYARARCTPPARIGSKWDLLGVPCREQSVALGERARPTYMAKEVWYYHAGCHPIFSAGPPANHWTTKIGPPQWGEAAFREIDHDMVRPDEPLALVCPAGSGASGDPVCDFARERGDCHPLGPETTACELSGEARAELSRRLEPSKSEPAKGAPHGPSAPEPPP